MNGTGRRPGTASYGSRVASSRPQGRPTTRSNRATGGTRRRAAPPDSPLFGALSLLCFALFWLFIFGATRLVLHSAEIGSVAGVISGFQVWLISFIFPAIGVILGIVGLVARRSLKIVAGIGLGLNGLLVLGILFFLSFVFRAL